VDFGCGYGGFLAEFASRPGVTKALGVDYSPAAIAVAENRFAESSDATCS
jgi:SAM-dependent methyltransferase